MSTTIQNKVQVGQSGTSTNNFHWRNLLDGILRLSRGSHDSASPVDVMRVNSDNQVEFPSGILNGISKYYVSPAQTIANAGTGSLTHGLGTTPKFVQAYLVCTTATSGFSVGDRVIIGGVDTNGNSTGVQIRFNATTLNYVIGSSGIYVLNATGAAQIGATVNNNFDLYVEAYA